MKNIFNIQKVCGFYVSSIHLVTKILPYINRQIEENANVITFLEYNLKDNIETILEKMIINDITKNNILKIEWQSTNIFKMSSIYKKLKMNFNSDNINILISGTNKYINQINIIIENFINKNNKKFQNKKITIINLYEVTEFNNDIKDILDEHSFILNTSGIKSIGEVFDGYEKKSINY